MVQLAQSSLLKSYKISAQLKVTKSMLAREQVYCEEVVNHLLSSKHGNTNLTTALFQMYATTKSSSLTHIHP